MRVIVSESMAVSSSEADKLKDTNKLSAGETNSHNHPDCKLPPSNTYIGDTPTASRNIAA